MPTYDKNKQYAEKYLASQDRITIRVPKESGFKDAIQDHAKTKGESVQAFIIRAIRETMERDNNPRYILDDGEPLHVDWSKEEEEG